MDFDQTYADYLDDTAVAEIQALEQETGKLILAYYTPPVPADLSQEQLEKLQNIENRLCVRLVAYETH
jgi:nitrate reductase NapAB chaperone NapD